ncbi:MAG: anti-sigma factor [Actinobacteria bacterium]|jgi:anti-sigma factor RsiW|nr:anti-sigma factor [Actinomycetota bacterium]
MTTGCLQRLGDLGAYVLGGLEPDETAELERHLDACAGCRTEVAGLAPLSGLLDLAAEAPPPVPADLRPRTLAGLPRRRRLGPPAAAALVIVAALGAGTVIALDDDTPATVVLALPAQDDRPVQGEAALRQVASGVRIELELTGLRPAEQGYYHAWLTRGERRVSAGTFVGDPDGNASAQLQCGGDLDAYDDLLVTWHARGADEVVAVQRPIRD